MDNFDELRKYVLDNVIEIYLQQSINEDNEISELNEVIKKDSEQLNKILLTLSPKDSKFVNEFLSKRFELENKKIEYVFEKGLENGYLLAKEPLAILFGNKNTHLSE